MKGTCLPESSDAAVQPMQPSMTQSDLPPGRPDVAGLHVTGPCKLSLCQLHIARPYHVNWAIVRHQRSSACLARAAMFVARHCLNQANIAQQMRLSCALQLSVVTCFCQHCRLASLTSHCACNKILLLKFDHHLTKDNHQGQTHCI